MYEIKKKMFSAETNWVEKRKEKFQQKDMKTRTVVEQHPFVVGKVAVVVMAGLPRGRFLGGSVVLLVHDTAHGHAQQSGQSVQHFLPLVAKEDWLTAMVIGSRVEIARMSWTMVLLFGFF